MRLDTVWRDITFAVRGFRRSPVAALTVVATLAVSLGLNATAFAVFKAGVLSFTPMSFAAEWSKTGWPPHEVEVEPVERGVT